MLLSQIKQTSALAWSPLSTHPSYLALGTLHSTLTSPKLSIHNATAEKTDILVETDAVNEKFVCMDWGVGTHEQVNELGVIAGGMDDSSIQLFDVNRIVNKEDDILISKIEKHDKQVNALKFNPKQAALMASAGADGNVFFWNLKNMKEPTAIEMQGKNPHTNEEVTSLSWNTKFDSIAASCSSEGLCVIWELKESKHVLKFSNQQKRSYSCIAWNPEVGTELAVASQLDNAPFIELWDLRKAYAPVKELKGHADGVLSLSWCPHDANLLLSSGKDGSCFIWNPSTSEQLGELPPSENWMYDVRWSYRPSILSTASYDSRINIYSLQDSSAVPQPIDESQEVENAEQKDEANGGSFLGAISTKGSGKKRLSSQPLSKNVFKTAPKWLKRPVGAVFGFGGRFVSFTGKRVSVRCVKGDELAHQQELDQVIEERNFESFCEKKAQEADKNSEEDEASIWSLMRILFTDNRKHELLNYLGYNEDEISKEAQQEVLPEADGGSNDSEEDESSKYDQSKIDAIVQNCVITSNWQGAVDVCLRAGRLADALVLAASGGSDLWNRTREEYFARQKRPTIALVGKMLNNIDDLVDNGDLNDWKKILAILCTFGGEQFDELAIRLGDRLEEAENHIPATLTYMCCGAFEKTISSWLNSYEKKTGSDNSKQGLIRLMQKIVVFQQAYPDKDALSNPKLSEKYAEYATLLASQGELQHALQYLNAIAQFAERDSALNQLRYRVFRSMLKPTGESPLAPSWVRDEQPAPQQPQQQQRQPQQQAPQQNPQRQPAQQQQQQQVMQPPQQQQQWNQPAYGASQQAQQQWNQGGYPQQQQGRPFPAQQQQPAGQFAPHQQPVQQQAPQQPQQWNQSGYPQQQPAYGQPAFGAPQQAQQQQLQVPLRPASQTNFSPQQDNSNPSYGHQAPYNTQPVNASPREQQAVSQTPPPVGEPEANFGLRSESSSNEDYDQNMEEVEISESQQRLLDTLDAKYTYVYSMESLDKVHRTKQRMIEKDLANLQKEFKYGRVDQKVADELSALCVNLENNDFKGALANVRTLASSYRTNSKAWIKGLKFLVQILSKL
mmetsp:Transcript_10657/g.39783  ORF Transcript_10657/g.39783 Transcript_10657/m.39783 type:complete len:1070 (-) Transcript_10657:1074-4283(-)|eukprot:CAMPEP_0117439562 /NCGR_PEP_ID=MMETSP0759-20121206/2628_1 /TAXON_ID=63605 /ORGANISM="Percolomonas cosmopolitus, Strain WS" /LENGTH=1069 /DNA_ID=CAMNT_0005231279 /DNA_START=326 /DNA_END=3535 /DNA_ORIENTATION=+